MLAWAAPCRSGTRISYDEEHPLIVCAAGGTAVGADLLRLCAASYPHIQKRVEDVRMVLVCGPRIDPATVAAPPGVGVRGYVPRLYEHLAASDVAIVQGGGTTTLELTALRRPFIHLPLEQHFEQNLVVAKRLARHGAGQRLLYSKTTPGRLAEAVVGQLGREARWPAIPGDGAQRAARPRARAPPSRDVAPILVLSGATIFLNAYKGLLT